LVDIPESEVPTGDDVEVTVIKPAAGAGAATSREFQPQEPAVPQSEETARFLPLNDGSTEDN
jgi:hypothetical protein